MKTLRTLMMFMALSNTALFAANFMHYHPEDRLCRAQAEPIETVGDQDMVLETILQVQDFASSAELSKFFLTTPEYKETDMNFLVEVLFGDRIRIGCSFSEAIKVGNINDNGTSCETCEGIYNFIITGNKKHYEVAIFVLMPKTNEWMEYKGPKSVEMIERYKKIFIGLFFKVRS